MASSATHNSINGLLQQEIEEGNCLLEALQQEYTALGANDLAAFEQTLIHKQQSIARLEQLEQGLTGILAGENLPHGWPGIETYLLRQNQEGQNKQTKGLWQQLLKLTEQCRDQNQINGQALGVIQAQVQKTLELLTGQVSESNLYGPAGKTTASTGQKSFGAV